MGLLKKIGKAIFPGTGRHAANRAAKAADAYTVQAEAERKSLEEKTKKEKAKAQKLAIRGIRSRRAASRFASPEGTTGTYGSPTIG